VLLETKRVADPIAGADVSVGARSTASPRFFIIQRGSIHVPVPI
jgi:hypothetical protein